MKPFVICPKCKHLDASRKLCQCGYGEAPPPKQPTKTTQGSGGESWARRTARYSAMFPLGALFAMFLTQTALRSLIGSDPLALWTMLALYAVLLLAGIGFGVAALCGMVRHPEEGILGKALFGITLSLGIILWWAWGFLMATR